jgi:IclR family transcriptional regulator, KDG regulon repressor
MTKAYANTMKRTLGRSASRKHKPVKSLVKALRVLDALSDGIEGLGITDLSSRLNTPKSTVHRLIATLEIAGYVAFDPSTAKYSLGGRAARLAEQLNRQSPLLLFGAPMLERLTKECHEASHLAILQGTDVVYISHEESREPVRISFGRGHRAPAHCTALGKVFLAGMSDSEILMLYRNYKRLEKLTPQTIGSMDKLLADIAGARREGIGYDNEEYTRGLRCMAAPIRDFSSRIVAAMSLSMFKHKMTGERKAFFKDALLRATTEVSEKLGFTPLPKSP